MTVVYVEGMWILIPIMNKGGTYKTIKNASICKLIRIKENNKEACNVWTTESKKAKGVQNPFVVHKAISKSWSGRYGAILYTSPNTNTL